MRVKVTLFCLKMILQSSAGQKAYTGERKSLLNLRFSKLFMSGDTFLWCCLKWVK